MIIDFPTGSPTPQEEPRRNKIVPLQVPSKKWESPPKDHSHLRKAIPDSSVHKRRRSLQAQKEEPSKSAKEYSLSGKINRLAAWLRSIER